MKINVARQLFAAAIAFSLSVPMAGASAQAIRATSGLTPFPGNDDGSTSAQALGFNINFFGLNRTTAFVNNNGNITFDVRLASFTPFGLSGTSRQIIAPFFADVDTRVGPLARYGQQASFVGGRNAFVVDWPDVGYFSRGLDKTNAFQLVMIDRGDINAGDFDFEFNYGAMQWETGGASGGTNGLGGSCARWGWSNGNANTFEGTGSGVCGALINGGPNALQLGSLNSNVAGRYVFNVRSGNVQTTVPEPGSVALVAAGLLGLAVAARRRRTV